MQANNESETQSTIAGPRRAMHRPWLLTLLLLHTCRPTDAVDLYVHPTGANGAYTSVQAAVNAAPPGSESNRTNIYIAPGVYNETSSSSGNLIINKPFLSFIGQGAAPSDVVIQNDVAGLTGATRLESSANDFLATKITFRSTRPDGGGVGLAVRNSADRSAFSSVRFEGYQDTLLAENRARQYYRDCYITGDTDFIFGSATAVFENSVVNSTAGGWVTAAETPANQAIGFVFLNSRLTAEGPPGAGDQSTYLGRPWHWPASEGGSRASVTFISTRMDSHIRSAGWDPWDGAGGNPVNPDPDGTTRYAEFNTMDAAGTPVGVGRGGVPLGRVGWADAMTEQQAAAYTLENIFNGPEFWNANPALQPQFIGPYTGQANFRAWDPLASLAALPFNLAGDFNDDGVVEASDYTVWRDNLGEDVTLPNETASPGVVDQADYDAWRANFGQSQSESSVSHAPEPTAAVTASLFLAAGAQRRRRCATAPRPRSGLVACVGLLVVGALSPAARADADDPWRQAEEIVARIKPPSFPNRVFPVTDFGARSGGTEDCTAAFARAIAACSEMGGGRVVVPAGEFLTGPIHLQSNVDFHVSDGAEIRFSDRIEDYLPPVLVRVGGIEIYNYSPLIYARGCKNVAITGKGKLNGNGRAWWEWAFQETREHFEMGERGVPVDKRVFATREHKIRPSFVCLFDCRNVLLEDFTISSGPNWTIHPVYCRNTTIRRVRVLTEGPNNDGIDPDSCVDVLIEDCMFDTGDDCVVLKSGYNQDGWRVGRPTENVVMRGCTSKRGHGGLVIGSEMSGGVRNVFMEDCQLDGTDHAVRIKSRADRGGVIEHVYVRNLKVRDMQRDVIIINTAYAADTSQLAADAAPMLRNMRFDNIHADGAPVGVVLYGMAKAPLRNLHFSNSSFACQRGVVAKHIESVNFYRVKVAAEQQPAYELQNARDVAITGVELANLSQVYLRVTGSRSGGVAIEAPSADDASAIVETTGDAPADAVAILPFPSPGASGGQP
ncbi:Exo-poly-alpha-D-galacturonosidase precursor [Posidoniimonas corsicana]|uniref:Probable pectate lyase C n=1 Tax=Posidoniimonas corsicana TaxID=1938618 RepID=A0A5C5VBF5_9BACT|nr:pectinesterase family protein [Posidoniimonas corsicana]TWT35956.1 Exo-poly-alpha-D-galacturonosidase precursor [Posidoniimonas corsicana]